MAEQPRVFEPLRNKASTKGTWTFGCRPDARKRNSSLSRSECRSEGTSAWHSRDVRDAEGSLVGCNHERVRRQIVGRRPTTGQRLVDAVTGDQSTDRHLDTDINVRATSQPCFPGREAGANALASRAQETSRECTNWEHCGLPRTRKGQVDLKQRSTPSAGAVFYSKMLEGRAWVAL